MIEGFAIPASPARARRLLRMSRFFEMNIDDSVRDLASRDVLEWPGLNANEADAAQAIVDCGFRCTIYYNYKRDVVNTLRAVISKMTGRIVMIVDEPEDWWDQGFTKAAGVQIKLPEESNLSIDTIGGRDTYVITDFTSFCEPSNTIEYPRLICLKSAVLQKAFQSQVKEFQSRGFKHPNTLTAMEISGYITNFVASVLIDEDNKT